MNAFAWYERNPVLYFVCACAVLLYVYGICWTIVLLFTLYLIDETFTDTEEEKIYGKQLFNVKRKFNSFDNTYNSINIHSSTPLNMFSNNKTQKVEKKASLQELVNLKRGKEYVSKNSRQPLAAIVKNNMNIQLSSVDLEKRKPIYQGLRSASPSGMSTRLSRNNDSPLVNRNEESYRLYGSPSLNRSTFLGSPLMNGSPSLNRSHLNMSGNLPINNTVASPLNNSLEVHGSYFINKSVLHSPCSEKTISNSVASPSNVTFHNTIKNSISSHAVKCSTESVVEALKQKSKRKRAQADSIDESDIKKKRTDDIDSTLNDLLPNNEITMGEQALSSKRKVSEKEVTSTGIQCVITEETATKKKKVQSETPKYGISQAEMNDLSDENASSSDVEKTEQITVNRKTDESEVTPKTAMKDLIKNIAHDSSFKSVSFSDFTPDKTDSKTQEEICISKSSLKLSALKNMESPYKRLFKDGALKNITPESMKKMRKHPVYFTAKIDIDEIQQHREEYGASGVSLKAFRLDKEEAIKRVDSLFNEADSDIDFNTQTSVVSVTTSVLAVTSTISLGMSTNLASTTLTSAGIKSNLFGATTSSTIVSSTSALSTPSFSFGNLTSLTSLAPITSTTTISSASTATAFPLLPNNSIATTAELKLSSSISVSTTSTTFNFGALPTTSLLASAQSLISAATTVVSTQAATLASAIKLPQLPSTGSNFSFGLGGSASTATTIQPALQFPPAPKPIAASIPTLPSVPSLSALPTVPTASSTLTTSLPSNTQFNFSFQPSQVTNTSQFNQSSAQTTTASAQPATIPPNGLFGANASTSQSFGFGTGSATNVSKDLSSSSGFSFTAAPVASNLPVSSTVPSNIFGTNSTFGSGATTTLSHPPIFGISTTSSTVATTTTFQTALFGNSTSSTAPTTTAFGAAASQPPTGMFNSTTTTSTLPNNIFAPQNKVNGFNFASTAAPTTGFSFTSTTSTSSGFSFTSTTSASTGGFSFPTTTTASTGFNFGTAASTAPNAFSASTATASQGIFGQAASNPTNSLAPKNIFGASAATSTTSQGIFGAPSSMPSSQNIFGAPASTAPTTQSIFGAAASTAPTTQSIFGNTSQNTFGSSSQNSFGASTQNVFGAAQPQPSIFGDQSKNSTGFNFGPTTTTSTATGGFSFSAGTTNSNVFGQSNNVFGSAPATNNTGVFGAAPAKPTENPFGQQAAKPSGGFDFSGSMSSVPAINFGASAAPTANAFNTQQPNEMAKPSFNFGSQPATPTFGTTPASPAFGNIQQPAFGSPQPFGTPAAAGAGGGFTIGSGTSNPPPSRQTQRARRRIRR